MRSKFRRSNQGGFTLVELLVASVILAILIVSLGYFITQMIDNSNKVDDKTKALELCRQGLEQCRTVELATGVTSIDIVLGGMTYTRELTVSDYSVEYSEAKLVVCKVTWSGSGSSESVTLSTVF
ncbi:MAG: type II secretion system GspH family protein [Candidatus Aegiribacteria sp.]|nr:type II secretion system GspH family protein [Candidatus Aegiribacteria sp.]